LRGRRAGSFDDRLEKPCALRERRARGIALFVRVLPEEESLAACRRAGVPRERIIAA
jgi:precorrin-6x reductase